MNLKSILNHKLVQAGGWYTFTNFFVSGISFITIPIFTRLLTTEDYGIVSLYMTWVGLFSVFISLDLAWSVQRGKFDFERDFNKYTSSILFLSLILFALFMGVFVIFEDFFVKLTGLPKWVFYLMVTQSYFTFVQGFSLSKLRVEYKYKFVSIVNVAIAVIGVGLSIFLIQNVFIGKEYLGKILGSGILIAISGFLYLMYFLYQGKEFINFEYWKYALAISVPFILHNVSGVINSQFDRIIINRYVGSSATGIYSFAYNVGMIISVIFMSFYQAYLPYFMEKMKNEEYDSILMISKKYRDIITLVYAAILFISPEIIRIMSNESYWEGLNIIPFIFMAYYFNFMYTFETNTEYYYKKTKYISIGTTIAAAVNVILNFIFIPRYGYFAAAITTVVSFFVIFIFHYYITSRVMKNSMYGFKFHLTSFAYLMLITVFFMVFKDFIVIRIMGLVVLGILSYRLLKGFMRKEATS